jgi:Spy/CpxP family protein refolding chaperone
MSVLEALGKLQLRALALLATVFAAGLLAGVGLGRLQRPRHHRPPPMAMFDELDLTPDQRQKVEAAFQRHRGELDAILGETRPRVHAVQRTIEAEVKAVLTPEQLRKLETLESEMRRPPSEGGMPMPPMMGPHPGATPPGPPPAGSPPGAGRQPPAPPR